MPQYGQIEIEYRQGTESVEVFVKGWLSILLIECRVHNTSISYVGLPIIGQVGITARKEDCTLPALRKLGGAKALAIEGGGADVADDSTNDKGGFKLPPRKKRNKENTRDKKLTPDMDEL